MQPHRDVRKALGSAGCSPNHACAPESVRMWRRSACPTSAGTGTTGTPAIRQPVIASTVAASEWPAPRPAARRRRVRPPTSRHRRGRCGSATIAADSHRVGEVGTAAPRRGSARPAARQRGYPRDTGGRALHPGVASREVYRNRWMVVREDDIRRPDGTIGIYGVDRQAHLRARDPVRRRALRACRAVPVSGRRTPLGVPAGHRSRTWPTPTRRAGPRELREETGLVRRRSRRSANSMSRPA